MSKYNLRILNNHSYIYNSQINPFGIPCVISLFYEFRLFYFTNPITLNPVIEIQVMLTSDAYKCISVFDGI